MVSFKDFCFFKSVELDLSGIVNYSELHDVNCVT